MVDVGRDDSNDTLTHAHICTYMISFLLPSNCINRLRPALVCFLVTRESYNTPKESLGSQTFSLLN